MAKRRTAAVLAVAGVVASAAAAADVADAVESAAPFLRFTPSHPAPAPVAKPTVLANSVVAQTSPAAAAVYDIAARAPGNYAGMGGAFAGLDANGAAVSLPHGCGKGAVVSATRSWSSGSWVNPSGVTLSVSAYPAGMGVSAMRCDAAWGDSQHIVGDGWAASRVGDIIIVVSSRGTRVPNDMLDSLARYASGRLSGKCVNLGYTDDQSGRNPYQGGNFTGLIRTVSVSSTKPVPVAATLPGPVDPRPTPDASKPDFPFWPLDLPAEPALPKYPAVPALPEGVMSVGQRTDDPAGPGCGWAFTAQSRPVFDKARVDASNARVVADARKRLDDDITGYGARVAAWRTAYADYTAAMGRHDAWTVAVGRVASQWSAQRDAQQVYYAAHADWEQSVRDRDNFLSTQAAAKDRYASDLAYCSRFAAPPSPTAPGTPVKPTGTGVQPTPLYSPTPTPTIACPPERPAILDHAAPVVGPEPKRPADPRPVGQRN